MTVLAAHYNHRSGAVSVDGLQEATAPSVAEADRALSEAGYELVGDWLPANLGATRLVERKAQCDCG